MSVRRAALVQGKKKVRGTAAAHRETRFISLKSQISRQAPKGGAFGKAVQPNWRRAGQPSVFAASSHERITDERQSPARSSRFPVEFSATCCLFFLAFRASREWAIAQQPCAESQGARAELERKCIQSQWSRTELEWKRIQSEWPGSEPERPRAESQRPRAPRAGAASQRPTRSASANAVGGRAAGGRSPNG
jgi:hypothetical protein